MVFVPILIAFLLRILPIYQFRNVLGTDRIFHFHYINLIRKNKFKLPVREDRVVGLNLCNYPALYHIILSYFPQSFVTFWDKFSGLVFDSLTAMLVYGVAVKLNILVFEYWTFLLSTSLYIVSPTLTLIYSGPRAYVLTPRNFSQFIFSLLILNLLLSSSEQLNFIIGSLLVTILILSSWFSVQVLFFFTPLYTFLTGDFSLIIYLLISSSFLLLFLKDFTVRTVGGGLTHLLYTYGIGRDALAHRNDWRQMYLLLKKMNFKDLSYQILFTNSITSIFFRSVDVYFFTSYFIMNNQFNIVSTIEWPQEKAIALVFCGFFSGILTSIPYFVRLGEPERYIEFVYPASWFIFLGYFNGFYPYLSGYFLILYMINLHVMRKCL